VPLFAIGTVVSFLSGWIAVKWLIRFLGRHTLTAFGWYRIAMGFLVVWWVA
jgi:undecaprenyl-diphosphatase